MPNRELNDEFSLARLQKLRQLTQHLKQSHITRKAILANKKEHTFSKIFPLIVERVETVADFFRPYFLTRVERSLGWICISIQEERRGWWASYVIWLEQDNNTKNVMLRTSFIEPDKFTSLPSATTLTQTSTIGDAYFAAWNELDLICQSIIRLMDRKFGENLK